MFFKTIFSLVSLVAFARAHHRISYPAPRGVYVSDAQPTFCDGYTNAAPNRSDFPLSDGFIKLNNSQSHYSAAVLISIEQNPSNFSVFNTTTSGVELPFAVNWFGGHGTGEICIPVNVSSLNISGIGDGSNITLQTMFIGGHGNLFQCVDLTLRANATTPSNVTCETTVDTSVSASESEHAEDGESDDSSDARRLATVAPSLLVVAGVLLLL